MEFLVMPQLTGSPIECYSAGGDNCSPNICSPYNCTCNGGAIGIGCGCNVECPCNTNTCTCYGTYSTPCPGLHCIPHCELHLGTMANNPKPTM